MTIKAAIWDFSGVILQPLVADPHAYIASELGVPAEEIRKYFDGVGNFRLDLGEESERDFYMRMIKELGLSADDRKVFEDYLFDLYEVNRELIDFIKQSRPKIKPALCSNFSGTLRPLIRDKYKIENLFDVIVVSSEVKMVKPQPEIYQLTLQQLGVTPQEALFIDDQEKNVEGAEVVGMRGIVYKNTAQTLPQIKKIINY